MFNIGTIFKNTYPVEAAEWCNANNCYIEEIEPIDGVRRFEIKEVVPYVETEEEKAERIAKLTMTPLDFINFLVSAGVTLEQIDAYLTANLSVKMQLTYCNSVFCHVACALMPITIGDITITEEMVKEAFIKKYEVENE